MLELGGCDMAAKNIVICSDGTGNSGGKGRGTNVWRMFMAVDQTAAPTNGQRRQVAFYDDGVGTESLRYFRLFCGAVGLGISRNLRQLYGHLIQHYQDGDDIYLFGFSRGAYTVRVLSSMIEHCGLPSKMDGDRERSPTEIEWLARRALRAYKLRKLLKGAPARFKEESQALPDQPIKLVGVWDTVDAIGLPMDWLTRALSPLFPLAFSDQKLSKAVVAGRHALAIDETRATFSPVMWENEGDVEQVWFPGVHSNVGGGYAKDQLALLSLRWMVAEARALRSENKARLRLHEDVVQDHSRDKSINGRLYNSRAGFAAYYRYRPRELALAGRATALTKGIFAREAKQAPEPPRVHASVFHRIYHEVDRYAPTGIPAKYNVEEDDAFPLETAPDQFVESAASKRVDAMEPARDFIWSRRLLYYLQLTWTFWILLAGWTYSLEPVQAERGAIPWLLGVLGRVFPWPLADVLAGYKKYPTHLLLNAPVYIGLVEWSVHTQARIRDAAVHAWRVGFGKKMAEAGRERGTRMMPTDPLMAVSFFARTVLDPPLQRIARVVRSATVATMRVSLLARAADAGRTWVLPGLAVLLSLLLVLANPLWQAVHHAELTPRSATADERLLSSDFRQFSFETTTPMQATGMNMAAGQFYRIEVEMLEPWFDDTYPATPAGLSAAWRDSPLMWLGIPLRQTIGAPWFQLRGKIVSVDGEEAEFPIGDGVDIEPDITGELLVFINDAPGSYGNNHGSARIAISRLDDTRPGYATRP